MVQKKIRSGSFSFGKKDEGTEKFVFSSFFSGITRYLFCSSCNYSTKAA